MHLLENVAAHRLERLPSFAIGQLTKVQKCAGSVKSPLVEKKMRRKVNFGRKKTLAGTELEVGVLQSSRVAPRVNFRWF